MSVVTNANRLHRQPRPPGAGQPASPESRGERRLVSPFRCRVWTQHSRPEEQLTEEACKSLRESIDENGQHQPALGRPVTDDPDYDVEIICGARRHAAARVLGRDLLVEVRHMSDAEAYVAMYEENLLREGDSPYVRGQILLRALRSSTYSSQEDLARAFHLSEPAVSRLLMVAQLPSIVIAAFQSPGTIREGWGVELHRAWVNPERRQYMASRARALAARGKRPSDREVFETLITPLNEKRVPSSSRRLPVRGSSGAILFHEQDRASEVAYLVSKTLLGPTQRHSFRQSLASLLQSYQLESLPTVRSDAQSKLQDQSR